MPAQGVENVGNHTNKPELLACAVDRSSIREAMDLGDVHPRKGISGEVNGIGQVSDERRQSKDGILGLVSIDSSRNLKESDRLSGSEQFAGEANCTLQGLPEENALLVVSLSKQDEGKEPGPVLDHTKDLITAS